MPILPRQRDCFPTDLLDADPPADDCGLRWVAFYTLSRREKDLMRKLEAAEVAFYAPLIRRRLKSAGGRVRDSHVPLFSGYVFSRVDDDQRRAALATNTIARWLPIVDEAALLADLRAIKRLIDTDQPLTPEARIEPGQLVRVRSGPLRGRAKASSHVGQASACLPRGDRMKKRRRCSSAVVIMWGMSYAGADRLKLPTG
jgi:transcription antitermination factor NusG